VRPVIFLGPSMSHEEAMSILEAEYRPPVRRGDLMDLPDGVEVVGIVDGVILSDAAVGHREILSLVKEGIKVVGGGSMGALRAAELADFGMTGVGRIFELYRSGKIEGDDEVVLMYDPHTLLPLSEPLINLRLNVQDAQASGLLTRQEAAWLIRELRETYFPERSYERLLNLASEIIENDNFKNFRNYLESSKKDYKKEDAKAVLLAVKSIVDFQKN